MAENAEVIEPAENGESGDEKRQRSTIGFPYTDYEAAAAVASAIHSNVGRGLCTGDQLAPWMEQSSKSSGFRTQIAAARLFGLIESEGPESIRLTDLGLRVVDQTQMRAAKAEAFLRVPLFKALYDLYKGGITPPPAALEREIAGLGVAEKQKTRARQVFESSATQTGFREQGPNRLVMPAVMVMGNAPEVIVKKSGGGGGGDDGGLDLDPLLMALLRKIPPREEGWPVEKRVRWFKTFAMNVSQVYDSDNDPVEIKIDKGP